MTADELYEQNPTTYRKALQVCSEAHMNPSSTPADVLINLVPILTAIETTGK